MDSTGHETQSSADILRQLNNDAVNNNTDSLEKNTKLLLQIHQDLDNLMRSGGKYSQGNMRDRIYETRSNYKSSAGSSFQHNKNFSNTSKSINDLDDVLSEVLRGFGESIKETFDQDETFKDVKKSIRKDLEDIAKSFGENVTINDLPREFGKQLYKEIMNIIPKNRRFTDGLANATQAYYNQFARFAEYLKNNTRWGSRFRDIFPDYANIGQRMSDAMRNSEGDLGRMGSNLRTANAQVFSDILKRYKRNRGVGDSPDTDVPTPEPQGTANQGGGSRGDAEQPSFTTTTLKDKTDYIYPIYLNTSSINSTVISILDVLTQSSLVGENDELRDTFDQVKENAAQNGQMGEDFISEMMGKSSNPLQSLMGEVQGRATQLVPTVAEAGAEGGFTAGMQAAGSGLMGIGQAALAAAPAILAILGPLLIIQALIKAFTWAMGPAIEAIKQFNETLDETAKRGMSQWKQDIKDETDRLKEDVRTMIQTPFEIMNKAAEEWYNAWDSNLKTITQTQGYTKSDLQNLMASYAQQLRQEGLTDVVSAADISNNLAQVLSSGLSGKLAEEFAYQATILNNAIPTQNFFDYASTYASIAANAKVSGASMDEAIAKANAQLQQFASNVLYASREISGGFSTGLQNASELFADAVKIANSAGIRDSSYISGVLASVSSAVGAIAPDLASSLVDVITNTALGGNSPEFTALRSLAGTGASNTAFLKALAQNPQQVFGTLFTNLAHMQKMSADNFMEVAEGLSSTFGVSMDAFARVDFNYLAQVISAMEVNSDSLGDNLKLLASGQSTTTQEQMKIAEINKMIINEGLSYVLDNEAARMIQQHMWDQELAHEMESAEYAVNLRGSALNFIEGISETIQRIMDILNPIGWAIRTIGNLIATTTEYNAQRADIYQLLELGKVGVGNLTALTKLTTTNVALLKRETGLIERMGGVSAYGRVSAGTQLFNLISTPGAMNRFARLDTINTLITSMAGAAQSLKQSSDYTASSMYNWNIVGKSLNNTIFATPVSSKAYTPVASRMGFTGEVKTDTQDKINANRLQNFLDSMEQSAQVDMKNPSNITTYESWRATAGKYGIKDLDAELKKSNISEAELRSSYESYQTTAASKYEWDREQVENQFWEKSMEFYETMIANMDELMNTILRQEWMSQRWDQDWVGDQWKKNWLEDNWNQKWLNQAWNENWLQNSWGKDWIQDAWNTKWIQDAWNTKWIGQTWTVGWIATTWTGWVTTFKDAWSAWTEIANNWITDQWTDKFINGFIGSDGQPTYTWSAFSEAYKDDWLGEGGAWYKFIGAGESASWSNFYDKLITKWLGGDSAESKSWISFFQTWNEKNSSDRYLNSIFGGGTSYDVLFGKTPDKTGARSLEQSLSQVQNAEGSDLALQLANTLVKSSDSLKDALKDPTVQTNVLLSQILIVLNQLMEAENSSGGATLATSLSGLALLKT